MSVVLVTGASGFLGRRLVPLLQAQGHHVLLLGRETSVMPEGIEGIRIPEFSPHRIRTALIGRHFDAVVNLAAYGVKPTERDAERMFAVNTVAAIALAEAAAKAGAKVFLQAGSSAEYADAARAPLDESAPLQSRRLYGASKAAASLALASLGPALGLSTLVLRLFNLYGPGEAPHRLFPSLVARLRRRESVPLSPGDQQRDFIHVDDAAMAFVQALARAGLHSGSIIDICTGTSTSVRQFAECVADCVGADRALLQFGAINMRPDDLMCTIGNPNKMHDAIGFHARYALRDGIAQAIGEEAVGDG